MMTMHFAFSALIGALFIGCTCTPVEEPIDFDAIQRESVEGWRRGGLPVQINWNAAAACSIGNQGTPVTTTDFEVEWAPAGADLSALETDGRLIVSLDHTGSSGESAFGGLSIFVGGSDLQDPQCAGRDIDGAIALSNSTPVDIALSRDNFDSIEAVRAMIEELTPEQDRVLEEFPGGSDPDVALRAFLGPSASP